MRAEYASIVVFFQVFDVVKDVFFLATSTDDPLFFLLTIFDIQLSWIMLVELYAEPGFDLSFLDYIKTVAQSALYAAALVATPSLFVFFYGMLYGIYIAWRGKIEREEKETPRHDACCRCCGCKQAQVSCLSLLVAKQREKTAASVANQNYTVESGDEALRKRLQERAKQLKTISVILLESATSFYQVYTLLLTGEFQEAYYKSLESNVTFPGASVDSEIWFVPTYPETALINVTVYTFIISFLVALYLLHVCSCEFGSFAVTIVLSLAIGMLIVLPVMPYVTFLPESVEAVVLFSLLGSLAVCILGYTGLQVQRYASHIVKTSEIQYVSAVVFFQVFDVAKDVFFLLFLPEDPFVLILTVFDMVLSWLMLVEFYGEAKYGLRLREYTACIIHYGIVAALLLLTPGLYVLCASMI